MEKIASYSTELFLLVLFVATFVLAWLLSVVWRKGKSVAAAAKEKAKPSKRSLGFFSTVIVVLLFVTAALVLAVLRVYTAFSSHEMVAIVECYHSSHFGDNSFELVLTRVENGKYQTPESFIIKGQDWSLGGDILEWNSLMTMLGFKSMYRLTRLQGRYENADDEMSQSMTAYALVEEEKDDLWEKLYEIAVKSPIIKSAHKNFVAAHPFFGDYFEIYVTPTGYTLERFEGNAKRGSE